MPAGELTVLVPHLPALVRAAAEHVPTPALDRIFSLGDTLPAGAATTDRLLMSLFGLGGDEAAPAAALCRLADGDLLPGDQRHFLRLDPVTACADLARVIVTRHGFEGFDQSEREAIGTVIETCLAAEGIDARRGSGDYWTFVLAECLPFEFAALEEALGADSAEVLPEHAEARRWRRVLNELQVMLHNNRVNATRAGRGLPQINSVWLWGGGSLPRPSAQCPFTSVHSSNPFTRGLALLHGCALPEFHPGDTAAAPATGGTLVEWAVQAADPVAEMASLEKLAAGLLRRSEQEKLVVRIRHGQGRGREYRRRHALRFWRSHRTLREHLSGMATP